LAVAVGEHVDQSDAAVTADHPIRHRCLLEQLHEMRSRHTEDVGCLDSGELGVQRCDAHPVAGTQLLDHRPQDRHQLARHHHRTTIGIDQMRWLTRASQRRSDHRQLALINRTRSDLRSCRHRPNPTRQTQ